jgi:hypothetical protein
VSLLEISPTKLNKPTMSSEEDKMMKEGGGGGGGGGDEPLEVVPPAPTGTIGGGGGALRRSTTTPHNRRVSHFQALIDQKRGANRNLDYRGSMELRASQIPAAPLISLPEDETEEKDEEAPPDEPAASPPLAGTAATSGGRGRRRGGGMQRRESMFKPLEEHKYKQFHDSVGKDRLVQVNLRNYSYYVPIPMDTPSIKTVLNQSVFYAAYEFFRRVHRKCQRDQQQRASSQQQQHETTKNNHDSKQEWEPVSTSDVFLPFDKKPILQDITLCFEPGKTYLIVAPPGGGKTTLLKAIAGLLPSTAVKQDGDEQPPPRNKPHQTGRIEFNGVTIEVGTVLVPKKNRKKNK